MNLGGGMTHWSARESWKSSGGVYTLM